MKPEFFLYSRQGCSPCRTMRERLELELAASGRRYACHVIDVDTDPELRVRFGTRVPVLVYGGRVICEGQLDASAVAEALDACDEDG